MDKHKLRRLLFGEFSFKRLVRSVIFIYAFLCLWAFLFADRTIFAPQPSSYQDSKQILKLTAADGVRISATYLPNQSATYTILYSHGNAEDLGDLLPVLGNLRDMGFAVFAYDYHGYGTSQGKPSEANAYRDIDAAYNYLTQKQGVARERIIVYGRSVGGGPSVDLASRKPVAGLILESTFTTAFRVRTLIPILPFDKFSNIDKIKGVRCPVLVIHGKADDVVPFAHAEQLFAAANLYSMNLQSAVSTTTLYFKDLIKNNFFRLYTCKVHLYQKIQTNRIYDQFDKSKAIHRSNRVMFSRNYSIVHAW